MAKSKEITDKLFDLLDVATLIGIVLMAVLPYVILIVGFIKIDTIIAWIQYAFENQVWMLIIVPLVYCLIFVVLLGYIAFFVMELAPSPTLCGAVIKNIFLLAAFIILVLVVCSGKV